LVLGAALQTGTVKTNTSLAYCPHHRAVDGGCLSSTADQAYRLLGTPVALLALAKAGAHKPNAVASSEHLGQLPDSSLYGPDTHGEMLGQALVVKSRHHQPKGSRLKLRERRT
jgi:hypothetical protein